MNDARNEERNSGKPVERQEADDAVAEDEVTPSSQGLGAVLGDAERTPNPGPVKEPSPADKAAIEQVSEEYEVVRTEDGEDYLQPRESSDGGDHQN
ncbi:hypothetical protein [Arthrobacter sp. RCC_34]|uniref:hypothetical protein n=1 Tax=Arthrobacter sp. RCC_34 TaxID=3239230 RepID=UPI003525D401